MLQRTGSIQVETQDGKVYDMGLEGIVEDLKWRLSERLNVPFASLTLIAPDGQTPKDGEL
jgi:hypothetical protein